MCYKHLEHNIKKYIFFPMKLEHVMLIFKDQMNKNDHTMALMYRYIYITVMTVVEFHILVAEVQ